MINERNIHEIIEGETNLTSKSQIKSLVGLEVLLPTIFKLNAKIL